MHVLALGINEARHGEIQRLRKNIYELSAYLYQAEILTISEETRALPPCGYRGNENLGDFNTLNVRVVTDKERCRKCDWKCFRDPSELFSPLLQARSTPIALLQKIFRDAEYRRLWLKDLNYYRACNFSMVAHRSTLADCKNLCRLVNMQFNPNDIYYKYPSEIEFFTILSIVTLQKGLTNKRFRL